MDLVTIVTYVVYGFLGILASVVLWETYKEIK